MTQQKPPKSTAEPTIGNRVASPELLNREENATSDENHLATRLRGWLVCSILGLEFMRFFMFVWFAARCYRNNRFNARIARKQSYELSLSIQASAGSESEMRKRATKGKFSMRTLATQKREKGKTIFVHLHNFSI